MRRSPATTRRTPTKTAMLTSRTSVTPPKRFSDPAVSPRSVHATFDGGHYFLTVLVPVKTDPIPAGSHSRHRFMRCAKGSPCCAAQQTPACCDGQSPFARNTRNHSPASSSSMMSLQWARDAKFPWPALQNALSKVKINLVVAQPQDHLSCRFCFFPWISTRERRRFAARLLPRNSVEHDGSGIARDLHPLRGLRRRE